MTPAHNVDCVWEFALLVTPEIKATILRRIALRKRKETRALGDWFAVDVAEYTLDVDDEEPIA